MKALMCRHYGSPETLTVEEVPGLHAGENEVAIRVRAAGLNFPDSLIIQNQYQIKPPLPFSPGGELAGEIIEVGPGVPRIALNLPLLKGCSLVGVFWGDFIRREPEHVSAT